MSLKQSDSSGKVCSEGYKRLELLEITQSLFSLADINDISEMNPGLCHHVSAD